MVVYNNSEYDKYFADAIHVLRWKQKVATIVDIINYFFIIKSCVENYYNIPDNIKSTW